MQVKYLSGLLRLDLMYFGELDEQPQLSTLRRLEVSYASVHTSSAIGSIYMPQAICQGTILRCMSTPQSKLQPGRCKCKVLLEVNRGNAGNRWSGSKLVYSTTGKCDI